MTYAQMYAIILLMNTYNVSEFAKLIGVAVTTLQRWDREGKLVSLRTPTNRRLYTDEHLAQIIGLRSGNSEQKTVGYVRVSSQSQKSDLENQIAVLEQYCLSSGIIVDEWVQEIAGGLNFKRKKFLKVIDQIILGQIDKLIIAHKDRLARFGFDLIAHICEIHNCELVVMNSQKLSPEQEMVEDVMTILHCFSARLYGLRNYKKALKQALKNDKGA